MGGTLVPVKNDPPSLDSPSICSVNWLFSDRISLETCVQEEGVEAYALTVRENIVRKVWTKAAQPGERLQRWALGVMRTPLQTP